MSGQLGDLVVSLSADVARFREDMGKAVKVSQDSATQMATALEAVPALFGKIGVAAGWVTAALAGGALFKDTVNTTKEVAGEILKLSNKLGITAEDASVLRVALDDIFLSADDYTAASSRLEKQLVKNEQAFRDLGVETRQGPNKEFRSTMDIMADVNSRLMEFDKGINRNLEGIKIYGKGWDDARKTLKLTAEVLTDAKKRAEDLHLVFGADGLEQVRQYKLAMKDVGDVTESLKVTIGRELIPILTDLGVAFGETGTEAAGMFAEIVRSSMGSLQESKIRVEGFMLKMGALFNGGELGKNWWTKAGREEIKAEMDAIDQMTNFSLAKLDERMGRIVKARAPKPEKGEQTTGGTDKEGADREGQYVSTWNKLQDKIKEMNPALDEYQKSVQKVNDEYDTYIGEWPEHTKELEHNRTVMLSWVSASERAKQELRDWEESVKAAHDAEEYDLKLKNQVRDAWYSVADPAEQYRITLEKLDDELHQGAIDFETYNRKVNAAGRDMNAALAAPELTKIANQLNNINTSERFYLISAEEAAGKRIELLEKQRDAQQAVYDAIKGNEPAAVSARLQAQGQLDAINEKLLEQKKLLSDRTAMGGWINGLHEYADAATNWGAQVKNITSNAFKGMEDALTNFVTKGKLDFKSLADSIITDMVRISIQQSITGPLANAMSGGNIFSSVGSFFKSGGGSEFASLNANADMAGMLSGALAGGGPVTAGATYLVGEKGPELFTPGASGAITPNDALGGGQTNLTVNIVNQSGQQVKGRDGGTHLDGKGMIKTIILEALDTDYGFRQAVRGGV